MEDDVGVENFLEHHGVKGMHWGIHNHDHKGASRSVNKLARKDAEEHARAKLYYGQGAGTRRKLINKSVEDRRKRIPSYGAAFDHHSARQSLSEHAQKAVKERSRTDRKDKNKKRVGYLARRATGEMGTQAAFTAAAIGGAAFLNSAKGRKMTRQSYTKINMAYNKHLQVRGAVHLSNWLKTHGG